MTDWSLANCQGVDPETMFPGTAPGDADAAKAICRRCAIQSACLRHALDNREMHGVWGGLDEGERVNLMRRERRRRRSA